jgi:hypothetical protein
MIVKIIFLESLANLRVLNVPCIRNSCFWYAVYRYVCVYVCMYAFIAPKLLGRFCSYLVRRSVTTIHRGSVNIKIPSPKNRSP